MIFVLDDDEQRGENFTWRPILHRHFSYFGDNDSIAGLLTHLGEDSLYFDYLKDLIRQFGPQNPRDPFRHWEPVDPDFKDVVARMTCLDPRKRITAREALDHSWFRDITLEGLDGM